MRAAEFMRSLADIIDALDGKDASDDAKTPMEEPGVMVSPLQRKIELMNKIAEVPSSRQKTQFVANEEDEPLEP